MTTRRFNHTVSREPIVFGMGGEDFTAQPILGADTLGEILDKKGSLAGIDATGADRETLKKIQAVLAEIFDLVLEPESQARVRDRLAGTGKPLDLQREVVPTITDLIEEYTGRPTQPSPTSSNGSVNGGTSSTAGQPPGVLTPAHLAVTAS